MTAVPALVARRTRVTVPHPDPGTVGPQPSPGWGVGPLVTVSTGAPSAPNVQYVLCSTTVIVASTVADAVVPLADSDRESDVGVDGVRDVVAVRPVVTVDPPAGTGVGGVATVTLEAAGPGAAVLGAGPDDAGAVDADRVEVGALAGCPELEPHAAAATPTSAVNTAAAARRPVTRQPITGAA